VDEKVYVRYQPLRQQFVIKKVMYVANNSTCV